MTFFTIFWPTFFAFLLAQALGFALITYVQSQAVSYLQRKIEQQGGHE